VAPATLTPDEFGLHLADLRARLTAFLERGEGKPAELLSDAEQVLALREDFPEVWERNADVEGLVADVLARQRQRKVLGTPEQREAPGCLLGWLLRRPER
jgi:hypothetical protein